MMFDKRNYALSSWMNVVKVLSSWRNVVKVLSSWRNVVKVLSPWRNAVTIGSIALLLAACEEYSQRFEEEYEFGLSADRAPAFDGNSMTDYRDNITYSVRRVGNVWWMMDDLAHPFYTDDAYKETYCYKDREETCDEIGRLYPGEYLDYACPKGWRFPSLEEWTEFFNSKVFREYTPRHNGASDLYKGYVDGEHVLNGYGEDAYYWTNSHYFSDSYIDCVHYKRNTSSSGEIEPDYSSLSTAELCHEQWKLAVRCVLDADSANASPSSSEQNDEEQEYDCSVTDGVKVVYPEGGETFALGDIVTVIFGSDLEGGFGIELRSADGSMKVELLDVDGSATVADGKTCNAYDVVLDPSYGVWTTDSTKSNKTFINVYSYLKPSKNAKSGLFEITFFKQEIPDETIVDVAIEPCRIDGEDACLYDSFTDERDGQTYKTVLVGNMLWMAENLKYEDGGLCYGNNTELCDLYGRLYTWKNAQTICPVGWRLPTKNELESFIRSIGGGDNAGAELKSLEGWPNENGNDKYGLAMLPGGLFVDGEFVAGGERAFFWTSTEYNSSFAYSLVLLGEDSVYLNLSDKASGFSVRCVWDR